MSNPFVFFTQLLFLTEVAASAVQPDNACLITKAPYFAGDYAVPLYEERNWTYSLPGSSTSPIPDTKSPQPASTFSGHVGWPRSGMSNPFVFFTQVSCDASSVKTSDRRFIQLTCPRSIHNVFCSARKFFLSLLMQCGDVEPNPGMKSQTTEQLLAELLQGQKSIGDRLSEIESKLVKVETLASKFSEVSSKITSLQKLQDKLVDLEDRSRRNNLLIFGVDERPDETSDSVIDTVVKDIVSDILKVKLSSAERIHRIGREVANRSRPVIVKFIDHREKEQVTARS
ncbi:hypothetical protein HPB48_024046 [Haemaphysalis longicornis]|uniref:Uncharacterized protein n=1 Tax=Haemaphysalis longicornis TaxID=44386 RepID=A0A9J6H6G3_HAELO|nr:hypothetical protein HPB48_024046 [Haemaphysalis longicornis]